MNNDEDKRADTQKQMEGEPLARAFEFTWHLFGVVVIVFSLTMFIGTASGTLEGKSFELPLLVFAVTGYFTGTVRHNWWKKFWVAHTLHCIETAKAFEKANQAEYERAYSPKVKSRSETPTEKQFRQEILIPEIEKGCFVGRKAVTLALSPRLYTRAMEYVWIDHDRPNPVFYSIGEYRFALKMDNKVETCRVEPEAKAADA